jgi:hypothetical protein
MMVRSASVMTARTSRPEGLGSKTRARVRSWAPYVKCRCDWAAALPLEWWRQRATWWGREWSVMSLPMARRKRMH